MTPTIESIKAALTDASTTLKEAVTFWWPAQGNEDTGEATYTMHFGRALHLCGCLLYAQVQIQGRPKEHIDLVAVNRKDEWILEVEAKQLYSTEKARELGGDWERLMRSRLPSEYGCLPEEFCRYGCLLASCWQDWNQAYIDWWGGDLVQDKPSGARKSDDWAVLHRVLREADCHGARGALSVHSREKAWLLYAVVPLTKVVSTMGER